MSSTTGADIGLGLAVHTGLAGGEDGDEVRGCQARAYQGRFSVLQMNRPWPATAGRRAFQDPPVVLFELYHVVCPRSLITKNSRAWEIIK
jgi:hypothetical protein